MANTIIRTANPRGVFSEGIASVAITPGTVVQIDVSEGLDASGRYSVEPYAPGTDGDAGELCIAVESLDGQVATAAYAVGERVRLYWPLPGEELQLVVGAGTPAFGAEMVVDSGTGKIVAASGTESNIPIKLLATGAADTLTNCLVIGTNCSAQA